MNATEKLELQVTEGEDGSAIVNLPPGEGVEETPPQDDNDTENHDQDDGDDEVQQASNDDDEIDLDRKEIQKSRREQRRLKKDINNERLKVSNSLANSLRKQNQALANRLAKVEQKTSGAELARVDKAIEDAQVQVEYAKMKMSESVQLQDGAGVAKAQELWYESKRKLESLENLKSQATKQSSQPNQSIQVPDPMVQRHAADWMERNTWYDPNGRNEESEIAQVIDKKLTSEGFDPTTEEYWDELDDRLKKYLPRQYNGGYNGSVKNQRPRSVMTSSGRETTATTKSNEFRLSPARVAAMKEAGVWDSPELRKKSIDNYVKWDRANKNKGN
jgi:hypothetical protein